MSQADVLQVASKWQSYRDTLLRFYIAGDEYGECKYQKSIGAYQDIILKVAHLKGMNVIPAMMHLASGKKLEGMEKLKFIVAGFELSAGNDYSKTDNRLPDNEP